jgi:hypothetical protein
MGNEAYYSDDYYLTFTVPATDQTPEVSGKYKPLTYGQTMRWAKILSETNKKDAINSAQNFQLDIISNQLIEWNITKLDQTVGTRVPVDFKNKDELQKINAYIITKICNIIQAEPQPQENSKLELIDAIKTEYAILQKLILKYGDLDLEDQRAMNDKVENVIKMNPSETDKYSNF